MRATNNSNIRVCVDNLLKTYKGEVPYSRGKGISSDIVDMPIDMAEVTFAAEADECIDMYESRVNIEDTELEVFTVNGDVKYNINLGSKDEQYVITEDDE